jgi:hypothetical protein
MGAAPGSGLSIESPRVRQSDSRRCRNGSLRIDPWSSGHYELEDQGGRLRRLQTFDPRPVFALADRLFPGRGAELSNAWRIRQFEYQWLRALAGRYADFWQASEEALAFAANLLKLDLSAEKRERLM